MRLLRALTPAACIEWFIVSNLAFLGVDIYLAHAANAFAAAAEWAPLAFSAAATLLLVPGLFSASLRARTRAVAIAVAVCSIVVGVVGMLFHLESAFFGSQTLRDLVYTAPFAAPLAYVGVGLLLLLTRMERAHSPAWSAWIVFLALGGFVGNLALSLLDHAQNGFFHLAEWVSVGIAAFGVSFLLVAVLRREDARFLRICLGLLAIYAGVGVVGFALHVAANLRRPGATLFERFVFGAPAFAPLLFADLALLAALGLWSMLRAPAAEDGKAPASP
ncbi:Hypothetical protein A7982_01892 [Minicystis rosea]|nr:Hypothetical protein A7982_01892 [Minicystis rosea]